MTTLYFLTRSVIDLSQLLLSLVVCLVLAKTSCAIFCTLFFYYYQLAKLLKSVEHKAQREILHHEELIFEFSNSM
jgi:hypothetical protein